MEELEAHVVSPPRTLLVLVNLAVKFSNLNAKRIISWRNEERDENMNCSSVGIRNADERSPGSGANISAAK